MFIVYCTIYRIRSSNLWSYFSGRNINEGLLIKSKISILKAMGQRLNVLSSSNP